MGVLESAEALAMKSRRLIGGRDSLAREYGQADLSPIFRSNGTAMPDTGEYARHLAEKFANWRLVVNGLVARPLSIPMATIRSLPSRTQITRHDCVEGWSAIGKWHGVVLGRILNAAGLSTRARYVVFHCADRFGQYPYYESIDLIDAFHPQTILAWGMNDRLLPVPTERRCACASNDSSATSMRNTCSASRRSRPWLESIAARAGSGKIIPATGGTRGSRATKLQSSARSGSVEGRLRRLVPSDFSRP
jgi:hypothetical protein